MVQARGDARLVDEHRDELGLLGEVWTQSLNDRQLAKARARGAGLDRQKDVRHAAVTELGEQLVLAEGCLSHTPKGRWYSFLPELPSNFAILR